MNLSTSDAQTKIQELTSVIRGHAHRYYVLDEPTIPDSNIDSWKIYLKRKLFFAMTAKKILSI
jgi:NAD-dependent DNA ligase